MFDTQVGMCTVVAEVKNGGNGTGRLEQNFEQMIGLFKPGQKTMMLGIVVDATIIRPMVLKPTVILTPDSPHSKALCMVGKYILKSCGVVKTLDAGEIYAKKGVTKKRNTVELYEVFSRYLNISQIICST